MLADLILLPRSYVGTGRRGGHLGPQVQVVYSRPQGALWVYTDGTCETETRTTNRSPGPIGRPAVSSPFNRRALRDPWTMAYSRLGRFDVYSFPASVRPLVIMAARLCGFRALDRGRMYCSKGVLGLSDQLSTGRVLLSNPLPLVVCHHARGVPSRLDLSGLLFPVGRLAVATSVPSTQPEPGHCLPHCLDRF